MREEWDKTKAVKQNLEAMGLAFDPNQTLPVKSLKKAMTEKLMDAEETAKDAPVHDPTVVRLLEREVESIPRKSNFRFTPDQVQFITYMMDKHGDNYKVSHAAILHQPLDPHRVLVSGHGQGQEERYARNTQTNQAQSCQVLQHPRAVRSLRQGKRVTGKNNVEYSLLNKIILIS